MTHKPWQSDEFVLFEERQAIKCKFFKKGNFTVTLAPGYQGIPENLVINLVMWVGASSGRFCHPSRMHDSSTNGFRDLDERSGRPWFDFRC
ncbi:hypothetical protein MTO96_002461 [Rhipicephalus appendiculatus]